MTDRRHSGGFEVICLTDGAKVFDREVFADLPGDELEFRLNAAGLDEIRTEFNCFVIRDPGGALTLVDTGCGTAFGPGAGFMAGLLDGMGIAPGDIGQVVYTHLHGDHCGGSLDDAGRFLFDRAEVVMHPDEAAHWRGKDALGGRVLAACEDRLRLSDGAVAEGLELWPLPGHTPGHCGLRIGDDLVIVADIVHSEALQIPDPETCPVYDVDKPMARVSRRAAMEEIAAKGLVWTGGHVLGPDKFGRLEAAGQGFRKVAA